MRRVVCLISVTSAREKEGKMVTIVHALRLCASRFRGLACAMPAYLGSLVLILALLMLAQPAESSMTTGSYTGNGSSQSISGLGFAPEIVIIKGQTSRRAVLRADTMTNSKDLATATDLISGCITSLDSNGFSVGSDLRVNADTKQYYWVAFNASGLEAETGTYTGDGGSTKNVTLSFSPMYVIVAPQAAAYAVHRSTTMSTSYQFNAAGGVGSRIDSLGTDQFTVGSFLNALNVVYHYVAFKPVSGKMGVGLYLGTGQDNRQITGIGFQPIYLIIKANTSYGTAQRPSSLSGDNYLAFDHTYGLTNGIQALLTDGFEVGTAVMVNEPLKLCHYIGFGSTYTALKFASLNATGQGDQVLVEWETETEVDTAGFNVLRAERSDGAGPWIKLNEELIPSRGSSWEGASYAFADESREPGRVCWYSVEEVQSGGGTIRYPADSVWDNGLADADGDGMPDAWEGRHGIDTGSAADADADPDGDGVTNLVEYLAGTSPVQAQDCPRLRLESCDGQPALAWPARAGRTYRLESAGSLTELLSGSATVDCVIPATFDSPMRLTDLPRADGRKRFYRLIISPPR